ncbi:MAG: ABC transporter ATP-binding protein [Alphaproteobacteria bacterium]|nr:ABC transporter ATP-binding protein [Alphaproteobacteria bacterium]MDE1967340.1 ABC transporter ATP-binding protein [Alphaproteobacteria bacterium]
MSDAALAIKGLSKSFGGVRAITDVSLAVPEGSLTAVIGPNGAGKTTLFNLVTNLYAADSGAIDFQGRSIRGLSPGAIARLGLIRTFQSARIFPGMTARENALAGAHMHLGVATWKHMLWLNSARREERSLAAKADRLLELVGLAVFRDVAATDLPMGAQKMLEVVRALMAEPRLLLLDEPAAGLNDAETAELAALLRAVRDSGITLIVVEHNMSLVMGVADQVVVLDAGSIVAAGTPRAIQQDKRVIAAYVGSEA